MTTQNIDYKKIVTILIGGQPLSFKAYPDGSLVVIAYDGKKHTFTADQVHEALPKPAPKPAPKSKSKSSSNPVKKSNVSDTNNSKKSA